MKKYILGIIMAVFIFIAILPQRAWAADDNTPVRLSNGETALIEAELSQGNEEKVSSIQFSIELTDKDGNSVSSDILNSIESLTFLPNQDITAKAKVCEQRYHNDKGTLDIYIAGTEPLFEENNKLIAGTIAVAYTGEEKTDVYIKAADDSFKVVKGNNLETVTGNESAVRIVTGQQPVNPDPQEPENPNNPENPQEPTGPVIDKSGLYSALEIAAGLNESDYTPESFEILKKAVEAGKKVMNDDNATSEEVEASADEILNAIGTLVPVATTSADKNAPANVQKTQDETAKTGDWTSVRVFIIMVVISLMVIAGIVILKKYQKSLFR